MAYFRIGGASASLPNVTYSIRSVNTVTSAFIKTVDAVANLENYKQTGHSSVPFGTVIYEDENIKFSNEVTSDIGGLYGFRIDVKTSLSIDGVSYIAGSVFRKALSDVPYNVVIAK